MEMNMEINSIITYLCDKKVFNHITSMEPITIGASGAKLFLVTDNNKKYVLKIFHSSYHEDKKIMELYQKEYAFYQLNQEMKLTYIPKIKYAEIHDEYGIFIVMNYYSAIKHNQWDINTQKRAIDLCAKFNSIDINKVSSLKLEFNETQLNRESTEQSYQEWKDVIHQHKGRFDESILDEIYQNLNVVCPILNEKPHNVCHGDFHPENILCDGEQLLICDWQNIGIGKSIGDLSFFISRGIGMGIDLNADRLLDYYCEKLSEYKGVTINKTTLLREKHASSVLTTFSFWAFYLKNCSYERVAAQFHEMVDSYRYLILP